MSRQLADITAEGKSALAKLHSFVNYERAKAGMESVTRREILSDLVIQTVTQEGRLYLCGVFINK